MTRRGIFDGAIRALVKVLGLAKGGRVVCRLLEHITPTATIEHAGRRFVFSTPNTLTLWRANTLFSKEPETIEWIDSFQEDDVFYDIGANVGVYTIFAGVAKKDLTIVAFEPTFFNYWLLNQNIRLNHLEGRARALSIALSKEDALDFIYMPVPEAGASMVNFGANVGFDKKPFAADFRQGSIAFSLDSFIAKFKPPFPNHIKLDVDGIEGDIVHGAQQTLADPRMRSLSVELNESLSESLEIKAMVESCGLKLRQKKHSAMVRGSAYETVYNCVFERPT